VRVLLESGEAAWCPPVRLELWNGVGDEGDRRILRDFERTLPELPVTEDVWRAAFALADRCRRAGQTAPAIDVLIAACARHHRVDLDHADSHFEILMTL
jgi:predicted nucleic acid-binding protein